MHELSIAQSLLEVALGSVKDPEIKQIRLIKLRIGRLTGVEPEALRFAWTAVSAGTIAAGAMLDVDWVPLTGRCHNCRQDLILKQYHVFCPVCRSPAFEMTSGQELTMDYLEVDTADEN
ncbi:hydrogenase/urease nickel incorporation metallochaperone hypa [Lucifera butyrica]|uniref:Hydrogenase maturation factor HypA n=1 Tax=Lucifera butyrica TaxID=1351585 RepID=A0A498R852_9FIRM|nr:hydrogenase maturation nickel metallochaperone HypA [Lucifera butyrica]VBB05318.1 hydrogenase/urease nickel incorporation metallochaperone hypa [Lucifera butyrica]